MTAHYQYTLSEDFVADSNLRYLRQHAWRKHFLGIKGVLALILLVLGAVVAAVAKSWLLIPLATIAGTVFPGFAIDAWIEQRQFRKSPHYNDEISITLSDEGLNVTGRTSETRFAWSTFTKARRFSDGLLLFQGPQLMNWLPDSGAADSASVGEAEHLVRSNVQDFRDA
jgi:hypothetical protein